MGTRLMMIWSSEWPKERKVCIVATVTGTIVTIRPNECLWLVSVQVLHPQHGMPMSMIGAHEDALWNEPYPMRTHFLAEILASESYLNAKQR